MLTIEHLKQLTPEQRKSIDKVLNLIVFEMLNFEVENILVDFVYKGQPRPELEPQPIEQPARQEYQERNLKANRSAARNTKHGSAMLELLTLINVFKMFKLK